MNYIMIVLRYILDTVCRRLRGGVLLYELYNDSVALYSWYRLPTAKGECCYMNYIMIVLRYILDTVCRRLRGGALLYELYNNSVALYSWYHILFYYDSVERFQLNTQIKNTLYTVLSSFLLLRGKSVT